MRKQIVAIMLAACIFVLTGCGTSQIPGGEKEKDKGNTTISDKGGYYEVILDFTSGTSRTEIGKEYGRSILKSVPEYEELMDSYLAEVTADDNEYKGLIARAADIKLKLDKEYLEEIDGLASGFSAKKSIRGDKKLSQDEVYVFNLLPDVLRGTQCSAFGVYGPGSATGKNISARLLDWIPGQKNQLPKLQAVVKFKNGDKSFYSIGYLGYMGIISGFNDDRVFAAILDSPTRKLYSSKDRRSYPFDIRHALENEKTLQGVADYMKDPEKKYAYSHLIFLSDPEVSKVLENNISAGANSLRELRDGESKLNQSIEWGIKDSVGTVNSFLLKGNLDNHKIVKINYARWESMKKQMKSLQGPFTVEDVKRVTSFNNDDGPGKQETGDLYNSETQQIIIFEPSSLYLEIAFRPKSGPMPDVPKFLKVEVDFN